MCPHFARKWDVSPFCIKGMDILSQRAFQAINGFVWGLIIALSALGLTLVFGLLEVINVSHGALYMLGAVFAWYMERFFGNFWIGLALAPLLVGIIGLIIERGVLRPIEDKPAMTIIATFGLMLIFHQAVLATFGGAPQRMREPIQFGFSIFGFGYPGYRLIVAAFSVAAMAGLWAFLYKTKFGLWMRAVRQDREMALAMGIPMNFVYMMTFGLGSFLAALGGVLAAPIVVVDFKMGLDILIITFIVVIIGGLGSLLGSVVAAILIGELEGIASVFVSPTNARVLSLVFMVIVLLIRPHGLFGRKA